MCMIVAPMMGSVVCGFSDTIDQVDKMLCKFCLWHINAKCSRSKATNSCPLARGSLAIGEVSCEMKAVCYMQKSHNHCVQTVLY